MGYGTASFLCNLARATIACITAVRKLHGFAEGLFNFCDSSPGFTCLSDYNLFFSLFFCVGGFFQTDSEWEGIGVMIRAADTQLGNWKG